MTNLVSSSIPTLLTDYISFADQAEKLSFILNLNEMLESKKIEMANK